MSSLMRQLRREKQKPQKTQIGVYGLLNPMSLLVDGDILLVFEVEEDLKNYVSKHKPLSPPLHIKPMYFEEMMQGISLGARYSLRRGVAKKFLHSWSSQFKEKPPFSHWDIDKIEDFLCLTANG
jgi:hypothetical protein